MGSRLQIWNRPRRPVPETPIWKSLSGAHPLDLADLLQIGRSGGVFLDLEVDLEVQKFTVTATSDVDFFLQSDSASL